MVGTPEPGLQTEYVQNLLARDPVTSLGMRVLHVQHCTLEFVSLDEAQRDLSAYCLVVSCGWCMARPVVPCVHMHDCCPCVGPAEIEKLC